MSTPFNAAKRYLDQQVSKMQESKPEVGSRDRLKAMNEKMEKLREEFLIKESNSVISAKGLIINR
ncbi:hypothetical protein [Algoriphagus pacificus]|uniref:Uncharacterized protein n=1 Tax=Algoriphagus pacificus TaxID=2811234 RepID=A0ABS3CDG0_9BACT|nr:hypothetical protein [Algoriphagus pacificus]MBN7814216.1 hypothetical protein [Algoriphagus pacificus]